MGLAQPIPPGVLVRSLLITALFLWLVLSAMVQHGKTETVAEANAAKAESRGTPELPYVVRFQQGATRVAAGDDDFGGNYFGTGDSVLKRWWGQQAQ